MSGRRVSGLYCFEDNSSAGLLTHMEKMYGANFIMLVAGAVILLYCNIVYLATFISSFFNR